MNLLDPTTLATGGVIAAVAGFWNQFKNILRQISALVVIQAKFGSNSVFAVRTHIKRHWHRVPSGLRYYESRAFKIARKSRYLRIPFRLSWGSAIYWRGFEAFIYSESGSTLYTIRGLCNTDELMRRALVEAEELAIDFNSEDNRFHVYTYVGADKSFGKADKSEYQGGVTKGMRVRSDSEAPTDNSAPMIDISVDVSYAYKREQYINLSDVNPFEDLFFPPEVVKHIQDAKLWRSKGEWYAERSIPWRRGWILEGPPGTGKSSLARAMAEELRVPLYDFKLNTMSDQEFLNYWSDMNTPAVALFEDFDTVFNGREALTDHKTLSFDTLLNAISGVNSPSGVLLIVTTNHLSSIDPAMGVYKDENSSISTRPGRIDTVIHLGTMSREDRLRMAQRILKDWPDLVANTVKDGESFTPAQFQELCIQVAFNRMANPKPFDGMSLTVLPLSSIVSSDKVIFSPKQVEELGANSEVGEQPARVKGYKNAVLR